MSIFTSLLCSVLIFDYSVIQQDSDVKSTHRKTPKSKTLYLFLGVLIPYKNSNTNIQAHALYNILVSNDFPPMVMVGLEF